MKIKDAEPSIAVGTITGLVISTVIMIGIMGLETTLILNSIISEHITVLMEPVVIACIMYFATIVILKKRTAGYLLISVLLAVCFLMIQVAVNIIFFEAKFHKPWIDLITAITGAGFACLTKLKLIGKAKRKYRYR